MTATLPLGPSLPGAACRGPNAGWWDGRADLPERHVGESDRDQTNPAGSRDTTQGEEKA